MRTLALLLLGLTMLGTAWVGLAQRAARAEEPWEAEAQRAEEEEDQLLEEARRRGTTRQVVARYASRLGRQESALNHYLLGRALYYDGDAAGAERQLNETLRLEPRFWFARLRMALLEIERKRPDAAEQQLAHVLRQKPRESRALKLLAQIRMEAKDWDRALQALEDLRGVDPANEGVRRNIAYVLMQKEDWPRALKELRVLRGRNPQDPAVRWYYATALFQSGDLQEASKEFEGLVRLDPQDLRSLDLLRLIYIKLEDWKSLQKTLERMLPLIEDENVQAQVRDTIERLAAGERPGTPPPTQETEWPEDSWLALVERCTHPTDVQLRRESLQAYYDANFPRIPFVLVSRLHAQHEPDPVCRSWVLRIIGSMQNPQLAQMVAFALRDPDAGVRSVAAETLGEIQTPSGLLYLMPLLLLSPIPAEQDAEVERVLNAARVAALHLTGRHDHFGGDQTWVPFASLSAMREDWLAWLQSEDGIHARLAAIHDLEVQADLRPELYVLDDVADPDPRIARAAYLVLLRRSRVPSEDPVAAVLWPRFPRYAPDELTEENCGAIRAAVSAWWQAWQEERARQDKEAAATPDKTGNG